MVITGIEPTKKGRYALFIEGEFVFSVSAEQMVKDKIKIGQSVTPDGLAAIKDHAQRLFARERALNLLSARRYTKKGLTRKLLEVADEPIAGEVADRMEELGLINDQEYARCKASDLYRIKKYGKRRVIDTLVEKGISRDLAREMAETLEPEEKADDLAALLERKYGRILLEAADKNDLYKRKARVQNALLRMGYAHDDIYPAIRQFIDDNELIF